MQHYFRRKPKKPRPGSPETKDLPGQNATIPGLCSQLEDLRERLRGGSRGISVGRVDVGQSGIERAVPEMLADKEGIRALLDHQHRGGVLQHMGVLEGLTEASLLRNGAEQLVDGHPVQLS